MTNTRSIALGPVQETLLIPLYGRALETRRGRGLLSDAKAVEMVSAIDYDFSRFDGARSLLGATLRTVAFDRWVRTFLQRHPGGTVVEIGAGLNTRFERLDNGRVRWFDLDLPDSMALRRRFFADTERRRNLAASVCDDSWIAEVQQSPGPHFFVAEAVLLYLEPDEVRRALARISAGFPGAIVAFDTASRWMLGRQDRRDVLQELEARFRWPCDDPREVERWGLGVRLRESFRLLDPPDDLVRRLPVATRLMLSLSRLFFRPQADAYRISRFEVLGQA